MFPLRPHTIAVLASIVGLAASADAGMPRRTEYEPRIGRKTPGQMQERIQAAEAKRLRKQMKRLGST